MKSFLILWQSRNKEFYRDKGSLSWALLFPILIIAGCAVAFSGDPEELVKIGVLNGSSLPETLAFLDTPYAEAIKYDDVDYAQTRLRQHQLHAVIDPATTTVFVNPLSIQSQLLVDLIQGRDHGYSVVTVEGKAIRYVEWVIPGVLGMNIMFGSLFGVGYVIVRYRKNGVLKRLKATPISPFAFLSAQVASRLFIVVAANTAIFIGSYWLLNLHFEGNWLVFFLVTILGAITMISMGLLVAARTESEELAGGLLNMFTWPMMFLSGVWFSLDDTPIAMQRLADFLPLTHMVRASREIMINGASLADVAPELVTLSVMAMIFLGLASWLFQWQKA
ncbi:putative multidrug ABC transporter permease YbhR [BD1-7 clade bacterium]|uniref:Transport permease protein n=1 Tax=BD1-7 clade bacterium TaxID=2029982 RepID=A0A5S9P8U9_9GAMM|nr:putative multidrug ABC transporter permease YbhR [BD1-7 clade bacterium]CAA0115759.1 putative multidrug ABC transporter permease YbhR [BD1-7 clade bacterium]